MPTSQPIGEAFGLPILNNSDAAKAHRTARVCPFAKNSLICTKDNKENPIGVCTLNTDQGLASICPVRMKEDWLIAKDAAAFFFPRPEANWKVLPEVRIYDRFGDHAGNFDAVVVDLDESGDVKDFGTLEIQTVYTSGGSIRKAFEAYTGLRVGWEEDQSRLPVVLTEALSPPVDLQGGDGARVGEAPGRRGS